MSMIFQSEDFGAMTVEEQNSLKNHFLSHLRTLDSREFTGKYGEGYFFLHTEELDMLEKLNPPKEISVGFLALVKGFYENLPYILLGEHTSCGSPFSLCVRKEDEGKWLEFFPFLS